MPVHGTTPDEVLTLFTRAGGSWWLALTQNRPGPTNSFELSDIPPLEVPRDATAWADADLGQVSHLTGVTLPASASATPTAAWCLFDDEACTLPRLSRWFAKDRTVPAGTQVFLSPDVLTIEFTPPE